MLFQPTNGGYQNGELGMDMRLAAFDIQELLGAQISTETRLGHGIIAECHGQFRSHDAVAAMRNVGKRPAMDKSRRTL